MDRRFNVLDEPWIPIGDSGRLSLLEVFQDSTLRGIGGNPVQKIAVIKFLLAICQRAATPADDEAWDNLGSAEMIRLSLTYLEKHRNDFWLYGEKPFLQIPDIHRAAVVSYGALTPEVSTGNATVLFASQVEPKLSDADKTLLFLQVGSMALSGKQVDNSVVLSADFNGKTNAKGRPSSGRVGPGLGHFGYQHSFYQGSTVHETLYMNLLTAKDIEATNMFPDGIGVPPWEEPPKGENDTIAERLRTTYMGRLVPMSRFMLDSATGLHFSEGIQHPNHNEGVWDPSASVQFNGEKSKAIWIDPNKRPWRQLPSILAFITTQDDFVTYQIKLPYSRVTRRFTQIGLWVGGLRVSNNAGERYCSGTDDYVESSFQLKTAYFGEAWYSIFASEMTELDKLSRVLWGAITGYHQQLKIQNNAKTQAAMASFWLLCEQDLQDLVDVCLPGNDRTQIRKTFIRHFFQIYDTNCPRDSARQMQAWAHNRPRTGNYLDSKAPSKEVEIAK